MGSISRIARRLSLLFLLLAVGPTVRAAEPASIDFDRQIRPLLSNNCFACHGPDDKTRKAKLRLDTKEGAFANGVIVPGQASKSTLFERVSSNDVEQRMPPMKTGKQLTKQQIELLGQWIDQGAKWSQHWAFVKPERPTLPAVKLANWGRTPIDRFILARLEKEALAPSAEADKTTLIRRVTLDLTGLPPTLAEIDAFLADQAPGAYEKVVERLLKSARYGERMAVDWLDAARFADTHGYHIDAGRDMSRWRRWVIDAFNQNKRFDEFTVEQLAGDLLPGATIEQKIASGFNRNHMINFEGGAIPLEYHTAYIVDRVNTMGTVWLGMSVACAQCHDHKFDPISQKEFYQLFAFFHNVPENGLDGSKGNAAPLLKAPSPQQEKELVALNAKIKQLDQRLAAPDAEMDGAQQEWEKNTASRKTTWTILDPVSHTSQGGTTLTKLDDKSILASGANPDRDSYEIVLQTEHSAITGLRLEALTQKSLPHNGPGRADNANFVLTGVEVQAVSRQDAKQKQTVRLTHAQADYSQPGYEIAKAISNSPPSGWAVDGPTKNENRVAWFFPDRPFGFAGGTEIRVRLRFEGQFPRHTIGRFRLALTTDANPRGLDAVPANVATVLALAPEQRSEAQKTTLRTWYRANVSQTAKQITGEKKKLEQTVAALDKQIPNTMVMQEMPAPRETFVLLRGQYDKKGEKVTAGVPAFLPPLPKDAPPNRLGLARWLVDPAHPLTARVIVNRYWQMYFGRGLVGTPEDFGIQGEPPTHPDLLDWLATEFIASGWDIKHMQKLIVTSAAYRQSSTVKPEHLAKDSDTKLLARAPRLRLQAEFIRDQALAVSGLLDNEIGGPSVFPYQPSGLWEELMSRADGANWTAQTYTPSKGKDLYRRTMYTFWKRTSPPPTLATFDAPDREICTIRRARTNTPLQALVLLNDPTYVEAARKLAERMMKEAKSPEERISYAFRLLTARTPGEKELAVLRKVYETQLAVYQKDPAKARKLLSVGESPRDDKLDAVELAAWAMVASVILNLDETITRN